MFTGIVQICAPILYINKLPGLLTIGVELPKKMLKNLKKGSSIAIDGVCLTATKIENDIVYFDIMQETLQKTTLDHLKENSNVNIERSMNMTSEIGGHIVSGHVNYVSKIVAVSKPENNCIMTFSVPNAWMKYIFNKGFIALDGCSLTVVDPDKEKKEFKVWFIPETLRNTTFGFKGIGDLVNLEIDFRTQTIVDTVEAYLKENKIASN